jgi:hypothetical protein
MYSNSRSCSIALLEMPTNDFEEVIFKTSKIQYLFIQYPNSTHFSALQSSWKRVQGPQKKLLS